MSTWADYLESIRGKQWLYIMDQPLPGQTNMDKDMELLLNAQCPCFRLYAWDKSTVSLGYAQKDNWVNYRMCRELNVDVVRRPTGGRALLHLPSEITYAVVLPHIGNLSVMAAFTGIAAMLADSLSLLGVPVATAGEGHVPLGAVHPSCLEVTAPGEVTAFGRKLVGSAQVRKNGNLLQHGSLPRTVEPELLAKVIPGGVPQACLKDLGFENLTAESLLNAWKEIVKGR